jgi:hypothetical protein
MEISRISEMISASLVQDNWTSADIIAEHQIQHDVFEEDGQYVHQSECYLEIEDGLVSRLLSNSLGRVMTI